MEFAEGCPFAAPSSVHWFVAYMRLHNRGVTPTVTPNEVMPTRGDLEEYWGPRSAEGKWLFSDQGLPAYEQYVKELFPRVLQKPWPISGALPYHFARGLFVEALGVEVNWADFAFRATHPHQSHSENPRILPEFRALRIPLPPLSIVMPRAHLERASPLAASIARHLNESGGSSVIAEVPDAAGEACRVSIHLAPPHVGFPNFTWDGAQFVKSEAQTMDKAPAIGVQGGDLNRGSSAHGSVVMDVATVSALVMLRPNITAAIEKERARLNIARNDLEEGVSKILHSLNEETQRLNLVEQKIAEKSRNHSRAAAHLRRARDALNSAKSESIVPSAKAPASKSSVKVCEQFMDAWVENVVIAHNQLESWELKLKRQRERVTKTKAELTMAEDFLMENKVFLNKSLTQLQALESALGNL